MAKFICVALAYLRDKIWANPTFLQLLGNALLGYRVVQEDFLSNYVRRVSSVSIVVELSTVIAIVYVFASDLSREFDLW